MAEVVGFGVYFGPKAHRPCFRIEQRVRERGQSRLPLWLDQLCRRKTFAFIPRGWMLGAVNTSMAFTAETSDITTRGCEDRERPLPSSGSAL